MTEPQFRELVDALPHLVWTCLASGPCNFLSRQWLAYTGVPEAEQLGYGWLQQLYPDDRARVQGEWAAAVGLGAAFDIEFRIRRADGVHRWFRTRAIPLRDPSGTIVTWYGSNADIDDYKRAEEAVKRINGELEQRVASRTAELSVANQELEAFSYSVAHDLRAPLRAMSGFSRILLDDHASKLDAEGLDCLNEIQANAHKSAELIDALLALSRLTRAELRPERVDLGALAKDIARELRLQDPGRVVEVLVDDKLEGQLDPLLAHALLENLIGNAWKFTKNVAVARIEFGKADVAGEAAFFVRDNGAGFDMAYAGKLFAPFQRLHSTAQFPGTGVGLATVQRIVRRHGGRTWAEGRVNAGATFYFTLLGSTGAAK